MDRLVETPPLPAATGPGPHRPFLVSLLVSLQRLLAEASFRSNETAPKDGSEQQQMTSYSSVTFPTMVADVDNADPGYYTIVKFLLTGSNHILSGIIDGAGQEGVGGRIITLVNSSASSLNLVLGHEDAGSTAANRFLLPGGFDVSVAQYGSMSLWYDLAVLRWRAI